MDRPALREHAAKRRRHCGRLPRLGRLEARRSLDRGVPVLRPHAVGLARAGGPGEHRLVEGDPEGSAQARERRARIATDLRRIDDRRMQAALPQSFKQPQLLRKTQILGGRIRDDLRERDDDPRRIAHEKGMGQAFDPAGHQVLHARQEVVAHVLLVPDAPAAGHGPDQASRNGRRIRLVRREDLLASRMIDAGRLQVVGIERLVAHRGVGTTPEGTHEGRREVARSRPHRDADRVG